MEKKYADVIQKSGGPYSLYCRSCKRWVPNTANAEMKKEGVFAHSHFCVDGVPLSCEEVTMALSKSVVDALASFFVVGPKEAKPEGAKDGPNQ